MNIEKAIETLRMENDLMQFDPNTGEENPIELQNKMNQECYSAHLVAISVLEKQIPKGVIETPAFQSYYSAGDESETLCPSCENELEIENQNKYCCECGQKLDWSAFE